MKLPLPLAKIVEGINYYLPESESQAFTAAVTTAAEGKDLSLAHWVFLAGELRAIRAMLDLPKHIQALVDEVIVGMDRLAAGKEWPEAGDVTKAACDKADSATSASNHAAYAAALTAAFSATLTTQAGAVDTSIAANAAADYAAHAYTGGYIKARQRQRDALLEIIQDAPIAKEVEK